MSPRADQTSHPIASLLSDPSDRRQDQRRTSVAEEVLSVLEVFDPEERDQWRRQERRMAIRRERDVRARIARLGTE